VPDCLWALVGNFNRIAGTKCIIQITHLMRLNVSLYIVKAAFSVQLSCSMAFLVRRKNNTASRYCIPCAVWSVSLSALCFSLFASVRYWFCWF